MSRMLNAVIQRQYYAVHSWKLAGELVNYRRFFDVSTLVGLSTERPEVFKAIHNRFRKMIERGEIDGLRVDHPDGLRDPLEYLRTAARAAAAGTDLRRKDSG